MNNKAFVSAITAMCLAASGLSFAQGRRENDGRQDRRGERGAGPNQGFYRGHNLSAPSRAYHWVQAGGDYVLIAIATGIITSFILSR